MSERGCWFDDIDDAYFDADRCQAIFTYKDGRGENKWDGESAIEVWRNWNDYIKGRGLWHGKEILSRAMRVTLPPEIVCRIRSEYGIEQV